MKKLIDFIYLFKCTWNDFYRDKHLAQKQIAWLKKKQEYFKEVSENLHKMSKFIEFNPGAFPMDTKDNMCETVADFVHMISRGLGKDNSDRSLIKVVDDLILDDLECYIERAEAAFAKRDFEEIENCANRFVVRLGSYDVRYDTRFYKTIGDYPKVESK